ncbi:phosphatidylserine decarboxylase [Proteiniclasticum sp. QWL-01]|uniref:phosphatidylserine decarboxylase n=1 Tax=Proteiniclasticum sp. QWL-01 TaxID=3036945 RepID=UPI00240F3A9C|nr:phosphatidylserine decarboxylase [Proteiniclasticum sp. QWL-01]WFF72483.1 phosphatidylserine decarboxylase [Proteiniclasticum sp. QWL-01]
MIYDRKTNSYGEDRPFGGPLLRLLYQNWARPIRSIFLGTNFSDQGAWVLEKLYRRRRIDALMAAHGIDPELFEGYPYDHFRDFFLRAYKKDALPAAEPDEIISPSDGKVMVHRIGEDLKVRVKGRLYTLRELMGGHEAAELFRGGHLFLIRLSLDDCHRFLYTENGAFSGRPIRKIPGRLHTVSALSDGEPVLKENERRYSILETRRGLVGVMEVGALLVGRIRYHAAQRPVKYQERGWFEPGGSTIILLYQKGMVQPDLDLIRETAAGHEVRVRQGERIGTYVGAT